MNSQTPFSEDYPIEGVTEPKAEAPETQKTKIADVAFDQDQYEISKPKRIIIKAKIIL